MKNNIYSCTRELAKELEKESMNNADLAQEIIDAIDSSVTAGEALMKLKFYLNKILSDSDKYSDELIKLTLIIRNDIVKLIG